MTEPKAPRTVEQYDPAKPIYAVLHQSAGKNSTTFFQGETAEHDATALAASLAKTTRRPAVVFGPQSAAYGPPAEVATQIRLVS